MAQRLLEKYIQVVRMDGINTNKDVTIGVNGVPADLTVSGNLSVAGSINFASTTFDDPVTVDTTMTVTGAGALLVNGGTSLNGPVLVHGQYVDARDAGNSGASLALDADRTVINVTASVNTNITLNTPADHTGQTVTLVLTALAGGETVDFVGATMLTKGTLTLGAGAGDIASITLVSNGTAWVEVSRAVTLS